MVVKLLEGVALKFNLVPHAWKLFNGNFLLSLSLLVRMLSTFARGFALEGLTCATPEPLLDISLTLSPQNYLRISKNTGRNSRSPRSLSSLVYNNYYTARATAWPLKGWQLEYLEQC